MRLLKLLAAILAAMLYAPAILAAAPLDVGPDLKSDRMFGRMAFIEDAQRAMTLEQVRALPPERFTALDRANFIRGLTHSHYWLQVAVHNPGSEPLEWVMQHRVPFTDYAEFWVVVDGRVVTRAIGGDRTLMRERQVHYRYPAVRHISRAGETAQVYISIRNKHTADIHLAFSLDSSASFEREIAHGQLLLGVLYGLPLALAFSALTGWVVSRDRRFSIYALYALSVLGSWMGMNGLLGQYLLVDAPDAVNYAVHIFFLLAIVFSAVFTRDFLHTPKRLPWTDRLLRALVWLSLATIVLRLADLHGLVTRITMALVVLHAIVAPLAGWNAWRGGVVYARWYVGAQVLYSMTVAVGVVVTRLGMYSYDAFLWAELAFFGELLLLSVAQYDRMRILQRDKEAAEQRYHHALENKNQELETQVADRTRSLDKARRRAEWLSRTDDLTGLGNRRDFLERAQANEAQAGVFVLGLIDLDYFKRINDTYGHSAGDAVLRHLGRLMRENTRPGDVVSRLGGEEFGVLLEVPEKARAVEVLERLRHAFSEEVTVFDGQVISHTLSIGYTIFGRRPSDKELAQYMREADQALYAAKTAGRNRVEQYAALAA
ncbi:MAG TPA: diguanylate cyclase [Noviherbaspirillum sp.]|uniref:sensor domain-containing diguanylate cyclase n=1 Tax=Noviherbaspirillum sp. TaxID=1926288 RepID=UPI002D6FC041|nr:diguanylate cyclase [Noviherbaspirillum sp.]HYD96314.1 diguanylate cyclase [Noviherbaspirillum sp.]